MKLIFAAFPMFAAGVAAAENRSPTIYAFACQTEAFFIAEGADGSLKFGHGEDYSVKRLNNGFLVQIDDEYEGVPMKRNFFLEKVGFEWRLTDSIGSRNEQTVCTNLSELVSGLRPMIDAVQSAEIDNLQKRLAVARDLQIEINSLKSNIQFLERELERVCAELSEKRADGVQFNWGVLRACGLV